MDFPPLPSYGEKVRAAHALADLMKRTRPHLYDQVSELQSAVNRCQSTLDASELQQREAARIRKTMPRASSSWPDSTPQEVTQAHKELEEATQTLLNLRHKGQMAR